MSGGHLLCTDRSRTEKIIMGNKLFKEVFPGLKLSNDIDDIIKQTQIKGITMFEKEKKMVISILSNNLIPKRMIYFRNTTSDMTKNKDSKPEKLEDNLYNIREFSKFELNIPLKAEKFKINQTKPKDGYPKYNNGICLIQYEFAKEGEKIKASPTNIEEL